MKVKVRWREAESCEQNETRNAFQEAAEAWDM